MTFFDTDVLSDFLIGKQDALLRLAAIAPDERGITIVSAEEMARGRLNAIRMASAGRGPISLDRAYELFQRDLIALRDYLMLPYDSAAHALFESYRHQKIRVGVRDLRIAAIVFVHAAKLVTRNIRDFGLVPGLNVEVW